MFRLISLWPVALLAACGSSPHVDADVALTGARTSEFIRTAPNDGIAVPTRIDAPGRVVIRSDADARVSPPGAGRVRAVMVREGSRVEAGDPLLVLDSGDAARDRAEAAAADADLRATRAELERQDRLAASGVGLEVERLRALADLRRAEAAVAGARAAAELHGPGAGGTVTLTAPMAGVVVDVDARPGLAVTGDSPLISVAHTEALLVRLDVYEDELRRVEVGQSVLLTATDGSLPVPGRVVEVAGAASPASRRGPVLVDFDAVPTGWVAGRLVRGRIEAAPVAPIAVPVSSVVIRPDRRRVVYVEDGDGFVQRAVDVGPVVDGMVPVIDGLDPEDNVVVEGALLVDAMADRLL